MASSIPRKGDPRSPTLAGTIFVAIFFAMAAALTDLLLHWGIWPWIVAVAVVVYLVVANLFILRARGRLSP